MATTAIVRRRDRRQQRREDRRAGDDILTAPPEGGSEPFNDLAFNPATMVGPTSPNAGFTNPGQNYDSSTSAYLDTGVGSQAFNNPEFRNEAIWSMLNQAGISRAGAGGSQQAAWLDQITNDLGAEYGALSMLEPDLSLENFMYGAFGQTPPAAVTGAPAITDPIAGAEALRFRPWLRDERGMNRNQFRDLEQNRRQRIRDRYKTYSTDFAANNPATPTAVDPGDASIPGLESWRQSVFYPHLRDALRRRWERATPFERGTDLTRYTGPNSVVAF